MTKKNYTIKGKTDGFGAQYHSIMSGIAYSKFKNYNYIHTPIAKIGNMTSEKLESLNNFIGIPSLPNQNNIEIDITVPFSGEAIFSNKPSEYFTNDVIEILRKYYYSTSKPVIENIDIAIHIRRGDVTNGVLKDRYTPNSYYNEIIKFLNRKYPNYNITILSEGNVNDFNELNGKNISFKLNTSIAETFHSFVSAKILITAKSSFSYCAAILNSNEIYYMDWSTFSPLKNWKNISDFITLKKE
uniref:Glycosyltransferase n=1 Tax=viral metagenome TaxID=1070528 RepID=A0A6C0C5V2_9ZZZZ